MLRNLCSLSAALLCVVGFSSVEAKSISPQALAEEWTFYGVGSASAQNRMFYMEEGEGSAGVMVVSPEAYHGDVTLRYELLPMNAASVCVAVLHASNTGEASALSLPDDYDGSMGYWVNETDNYFFAFHNVGHNRTPFAVRFPGGHPIGDFGANVIRSGEFHTIEISRRGNVLSLHVNGKLIIEGEDADPLEAGHIALRLRGISQVQAACLIRNLTIETR